MSLLLGVPQGVEIFLCNKKLLSYYIKSVVRMHSGAAECSNNIGMIIVILRSAKALDNHNI